MENLVEFVVRRLIKAGPQAWPTIADATEVPLDTLIKVARGYTANPRYKTLAPLVAYLKNSKRFLARKGGIA